MIVKENKKYDPTKVYQTQRNDRCTNGICG